MLQDSVRFYEKKQQLLLDEWRGLWVAPDITTQNNGEGKVKKGNYRLWEQARDISGILSGKKSFGKRLRPGDWRETPTGVMPLWQGQKARQCMPALYPWLTSTDKITKIWCNSSKRDNTTGELLARGCFGDKGRISSDGKFYPWTYEDKTNPDCKCIGGNATMPDPSVGASGRWSRGRAQGGWAAVVHKQPRGHCGVWRQESIINVPWCYVTKETCPDGKLRRKTLSGDFAAYKKRSGDFAASWGDLYESYAACNYTISPGYFNDAIAQRPLALKQILSDWRYENTAGSINSLNKLVCHGACMNAERKCICNDGQQVPQFWPRKERIYFLQALNAGLSFLHHMKIAGCAWSKSKVRAVTSGCWTPGLKNKNIVDGGKAKDCHSNFKTAKTKCVEAKDCYGIVKSQVGQCPGRFRVTHTKKGMSTPKEAKQSEVFILDRKCLGEAQSDV